MQECYFLHWIATIGTVNIAYEFMLYRTLYWDWDPISRSIVSQKTLSSPWCPMVLLADFFVLSGVLLPIGLSWCPFTPSWLPVCPSRLLVLIFVWLVVLGVPLVLFSDLVVLVDPWVNSIALWSSVSPVWSMVFPVWSSVCYRLLSVSVVPVSCRHVGRMWRVPWRPSCCYLSAAQYLPGSKTQSSPKCPVHAYPPPPPPPPASWGR